MQNRKYQPVYIGGVIATAWLLCSGCEILVKNEIRKFAENQTSECSGKVGDIAVVRKDEGTDHYEGSAEVAVENESYELKMDVKTGPGGTIIEAENSPCLEHKVKEGIRAIFQ